MTPTELAAALKSKFPPDATSWRYAGDEVRDMARAARVIMDLPISAAINFRELDTPSDWNSKGCQSIVNFYENMSDKQRAQFLSQYGYLLK